jgi:hypothetical protein
MTLPNLEGEAQRNIPGGPLCSSDDRGPPWSPWTHSRPAGSPGPRKSVTCIYTSLIVLTNINKHWYDDYYLTTCCDLTQKMTAAMCIVLQHKVDLRNRKRKSVKVRGKLTFSLSLLAC